MLPAASRFRRHLFLHASLWAMIGLALLSNLPVSLAYDGESSATPAVISDRMPPWEPDTLRAQLRARVAQRGRLRVIATLRTNYWHEGKPGGAEIQTQRAAIRATANRVLSGLAGTDYTLNATYEAYPFMSVTVDAAGLEALLASPDVASVIESVPKRPADLQSNQLIGAIAAHNQGYTGSGYVVAVLDTGVQTSHPFLSGRTVAEACFSRTTSKPNAEGNLSVTLCPNGQSTSVDGAPGQAGAGAGVNCDIAISGCTHGTHVAGIAVGKNYAGGPGYDGVAPDAQLISIQVFSKFTDPSSCSPFPTPCISAWDEDILAALQYVQTTLSASYAIAAVNMSLGDGLRYTSPCDDSPYYIAVAGLRTINIATVIAAGNEGYPNGISNPACVSNAISVGSTTKQDAISSFSNRAGYMSLFAPGSAINASVPNDTYATYSGTSMAAPHVAGAWAVMRQRYPSENVTQILSRLQTTGRPITFGVHTKARIQLDAAISAPTMTPSPTLPPPTPTSTPHPDDGYMIQDGSLEGGLSTPHWTHGSTVFGTPLCTVQACGGVGPRTGEWWAWFGGTNSAEEGFLQQRKRIAAGPKTLTFWIWWSAGNHPASTFKVKLDGTAVFTITGATNAAYRSDWTPVSIDISAYADGNMHTLRFEQSNQAGQLTNIHVDDISLGSPAAPTATPSPTVTPTPTPTHTPTPTPTTTSIVRHERTFLPVVVRPSQ